MRVLNNCPLMKRLEDSMASMSTDMKSVNSLVQKHDKRLDGHDSDIQALQVQNPKMEQDIAELRRSPPRSVAGSSGWDASIFAWSSTVRGGVSEHVCSIAEFLGWCSFDNSRTIGRIGPDIESFKTALKEGPDAKFGDDTYSSKLGELVARAPRTHKFGIRVDPNMAWNIRSAIT